MYVVGALGLLVVLLLVVSVLPYPLPGSRD